MENMQGIFHYSAKGALEIYENLGKKYLWQRMVKNTTATTVAVGLCLIPAVGNVIGKAAYLAAITTVFGHPGRRFGQLVEALILVVLGVSFGVAWSTLGLYLSSLTVNRNPPAAYAVKGVFLAVAIIVHAFLRSYAPRLFPGLILLAIASAVTLLSTATQVTKTAVTQVLYPILFAVGVILLINLLLFPEFSSSFLGQATIETLSDIAKSLEDAGRYFSSTQDNSGAKPVTGANHSREGSNDVEKPIALKHLHPQIDDYPTDQVSGHNITGRMTDSIERKFHKRATRDNESLKVDEHVKPSGPNQCSMTVQLSALTIAKGSLRQKVAGCKDAQNECNFEIAFSVLPPRDLKLISTRSMTKLLANTVAIISTCESKFALAGDSADDGSRKKSAQHEEKTMKEHGVSDEDVAKVDLELLKPHREIEFGDIHLLRFLLNRVAKPYREINPVVSKAVTLITSCIAYTYDVPKLPSGAKAPKHVAIEELDENLTNFQAAMQIFDAETTSALQSAAIQQELKGFEPDIMPREEIFLISSFLLNFSQAAMHIQDMLRHCRQLVDQHQQRRGRRRLYAPRIKWATWILGGGEQDEALPASSRKANRQGAATEPAPDDGDDHSSDSKEDLLKIRHNLDIEKDAEIDGQKVSERGDPAVILPKRTLTRKRSSEEETLSRRVREKLADMIEWLQESDDFLYASKLTVAVILVTWPAFIASWNTWFSLSRGVWAALQLIFVTEVSLGTSVWTFVVRGIGTTLGCLWGWAAWEALHGQRIVCAVLICLGVIPSTYVQLGTKYPKAGMVSIISMCVVALSTELGTVPGTATENFLKRWIAFMIGGSVALVVEMVLLPVKARTRLVESIAAALRQISEMENVIATGIEEGRNLIGLSGDRVAQFENASRKANGALIAAETFLPFCSNEPRIKGSFETLALIYGEILFVLHQIVDRMDNMLQLRTVYGSGPLEEFNAQIYAYRRNVAGCITITLFAVHGALLTKMPLPQYFPSARLAHLRMVNRVREVVLQSVEKGQEHEEMSKMARQLAVRRKYMAWNAASAAQAEIIEFLEELIDLTKLLVGANEFRSGLLSRSSDPQYHEVLEKKTIESSNAVGGDGALEDEARDVLGTVPPPGGNITSRRRATTSSSKASSQESDDVPATLRRIQSRKIEAGIQRQKTNDGWNQATR